jgi:DNA-binding MarR family transcriptional regulator
MPETSWSETDLKLEAFLPYRLNVAAAALSEGLSKVYGERFGLDIPGWRVLATLAERPESTATFVGQHSRMHKTKVSRAVASLIARGLVQRTENAADRREANLSLTPAGKAMFAEIAPLALAYEAEALAGLTAEERRLLLAALSRFAGSD